MRVVAHARGDDRVTRRKRGLGEKRRVDNINNSFEYGGGIALQRPGGPGSYPADGAPVANYRCTFGVRFRGEFVTVTLAGLIGIGSRALFDLASRGCVASIIHLRRDESPESVSSTYNENLIK